MISFLELASIKKAELTTDIIRSEQSDSAHTFCIAKCLKKINYQLATATIL